MKNSVKIAYWDTEQGAQTPSEFGQIQGTPTIKFITPSKKNKRGSFKKKLVQDYNGERAFKDMMLFAENKMPNFVERINGKKDMDKFIEKAATYGLPTALVFAKSDSHIVKHMSTEFRRRILIGEVKATNNNKELIAKYGVKDFPKVMILKEDGQTITLDKKPSFNKLNFFLQEHALKEPVYGTKAEREKKAEAQEDEEAGSKQEL